MRLPRLSGKPLGDLPQMLAEIDERVYDVHGTPVAAVRKRHRLAVSNLPIGRYFSQPLARKCGDIEEIRAFLKECRYESDLRQFGKDDHWLPPEQFEVTRKGDCEDFALWTWRQLTQLGYECRLVGGRLGFYRSGHAWLTVSVEGKFYLLEPQARRTASFPRLSVASYHPAFSVGWTGTRAQYYEHAPTRSFPALRDYLSHGPEWAAFQTRKFVRLAWLLTALPWRMAKRIVRRFA